MSNAAPSKCPGCGAWAYVGLIHVRCTNHACRWFDRTLLDEHIAEALKDNPPTIVTRSFTFDWNDEPTDPVGHGPAFSSGTPTPVSPDPDDDVLLDSLRDAVAQAKADPSCSADDARALDEWLDEVDRMYRDGTTAEMSVKHATPKRFGWTVDDWHRDRLDQLVPVIAFYLDFRRRVTAAIKDVWGLR